MIEGTINVEAAGSEIEIAEAVADRGYHANATPELAADDGAGPTLWLLLTASERQMSFPPSTSDEGDVEQIDPRAVCQS